MANAKNNPAGFLPLAQFQPHSAMTRIFRLSAKSINQVMQGPDHYCPPGSAITLRPLGDAGQANNNAVNVGESYEEAQGMYGNAVAPGADVIVSYAVSNLQRLWFKFGSVGDGLIITVQTPAVG